MALLLLSSASAVLHAQEPSAEKAARTDALADQRERTASELDALTGKIDVSNERLAELQAEVDGLRKDEETIRENLIAAAEAQQTFTQRIGEIEDRYAALRADEAAITASLSERRGVLSEVLAALQRMGRNPPPALLVSANDALASVRSAILLGAVVPEMRAETEMLVSDLQKLVSIRDSIDEERVALLDLREEQVEEEQRLALLLDEKRALQSKREEQLEVERESVARLAERAIGLQDLIASLETEIESVREAAEAAAEATRLRERQTEEQMERARARARDGTLDMDRFAPAVPFDALHGSLELPVTGQIARHFGDDDGTGHRLQGVTVASRSGAVVQAPADAWVVYSGPFRTYGQLLILNAGDEYHIVMAGMDRIDVSPGQFVVAGEPVAAMGETRLAGAAALALASTQPTLYIEFRKDSQPVDPAPWWALETSGRVSNDS